MDTASMNTAPPSVRPPVIVWRRINRYADHLIISVHNNGLRFDIHIQPEYFEQSQDIKSFCLEHLERVRERTDVTETEEWLGMKKWRPDTNPEYWGLHAGIKVIPSDPPEDYFLEFDDWVVTICRPHFAIYKPVMQREYIETQTDSPAPHNFRDGGNGGLLLSQLLFPMIRTWHLECEYGNVSLRIDDSVSSDEESEQLRKEFICGRSEEEKLKKSGKLVDSSKIEVKHGNEEQFFLGHPIFVYAPLNGDGCLTLCRFRPFHDKEKWFGDWWLVKYVAMMKNGSPAVIDGEQILGIVSNTEPFSYISDISFSGILFV
ncbi:uncharacterized protein E0L32_005215 [Thyridium curvatum]|uniref:Uncharacterized protein n=1 Tax=Thyridium curvatum TaxID=1093900 RepID=A0A507B3V3_9PEZI|nr:uncharacterized protein E0L32_005215 [Thyridium curvatum]TPX14523.1 hypothetical protein E0L32_005215 [Thyridium curvatum]